MYGFYLLPQYQNAKKIIFFSFFTAWRGVMCLAAIKPTYIIRCLILRYIMSINY